MNAITDQLFQDYILYSYGMEATYFILDLMETQFVRKQIKILAAGAKALGISKSNLSKIKIPVSPLQERKTIADLLLQSSKNIELADIISQNLCE